MLLLLLCLCGVRGLDGGLSPTLDSTPRAFEDTLGASAQSDFDMWQEIWMIRAMVVDLQKELKGVGTRLTESEAKIYSMTAEVADNKLYIGQLEWQMEGTRAFLFFESADYGVDDNNFIVD